LVLGLGGIRQRIPLFLFFTGHFTYNEYDNCYDGNYNEYTGPHAGFKYTTYYLTTAGCKNQAAQ
jgi:hypothetical protein